MNISTNLIHNLILFMMIGMIQGKQLLFDRLQGMPWLVVVVGTWDMRMEWMKFGLSRDMWLLLLLQRLDLLQDIHLLDLSRDMPWYHSSSEVLHKSLGLFVVHDPRSPGMHPLPPSMNPPPL